MINKKTDKVIKWMSKDGYRGAGHLGGNERPLAKYMPKEQVKKTKKRVKKGK